MALILEKTEVGVQAIQVNEKSLCINVDIELRSGILDVDLPS